MPKHNGREITDRREMAEIMLELLAKKYRDRDRKQKSKEAVRKGVRNLIQTISQRYGITELEAAKKLEELSQNK